MKTRMGAVILLVTVMSVLLVNGPFAQAQVRSEAGASLAIDTVFGALNAGRSDAAVAAFADVAIVEDRVRGETYAGRDEIASMFASRHKDGRQHDVLVRQVINVARGLNVLLLGVDLSDRGRVWGRETMLAEVYNGQIQRLYVTGFHMKPWYGW